MNQRPLPMVRGGLSDLTRHIERPKNVIIPLEGSDLYAAEEQELIVVWRNETRTAVIERARERSATEIWVHFVGGPCVPAVSVAAAYQIIHETPTRMIICGFCREDIPAGDLQHHVKTLHPTQLAAALRGEGRRFVQTLDKEGRSTVETLGPRSPRHEEQHAPISGVRVDLDSNPDEVPITNVPENTEKN